MNCKLCEEDRKLCLSHVIPEFFYSPLYDDGHRLHQHDRESGRVRLVQKGHRELLLCLQCEGLLNDRYEKYFKAAWYDNGALPKVPNFQQATIDNLDYHKFKLCLLSVLWRASVAKQDLFSKVQLGQKHEQAIRHMLLTDDPGPEELYPFATDVLWLNDYVVRSAVLQPVDRRYDHKRVYIFGFGGCIWWFLIGSEVAGMFRTLTIRKDGTLPIMWQNLAKLQIIQDFLMDHLKAASRSRN
jgi:hypothetical protein